MKTTKNVNNNTNKKGGKDNWNQSIGQNQQVLSYEANQSNFYFYISA
jgi:hypothetical protein